MKYEILRTFVKRDGKSFTQGQEVDESVLGDVGDLMNAKFVRPSGIRTATIKPESEVSEVPTEKKKVKKKG